MFAWCMDMTDRLNRRVNFITVFLVTLCYNAAKYKAHLVFDQFNSKNWVKFRKATMMNFRCIVV